MAKNDYDKEQNLNEINNNNIDSRQIINFRELKQKFPQDLQVLANKLNIDNANNLLKQELIFAILKKTVEQGGGDNRGRSFGDIARWVWFF